MAKVEYSLIPFVPANYEFVYNVKKTVYKKYVEENFGEWNDDDQYKFMDEFVLSSADHIFIIVSNGEKIGFVNGKNLDDGSYEQGNLCILPNWQGKGIGTEILQKVISEHSNQTIKLRVFKQNPAKNLYEKLGFEVVGETKSHFLMERKSK